MFCQQKDGSCEAETPLCTKGVIEKAFRSCGRLDSLHFYHLHLFFFSRKKKKGLKNIPKMICVYLFFVFVSLFVYFYFFNIFLPSFFHLFIFKKKKKLVKIFQIKFKSYLFFFCFFLSGFIFIFCCCYFGCCTKKIDVFLASRMMKSSQLVAVIY